MTTPESLTASNKSEMSASEPSNGEVAVTNDSNVTDQVVLSADDQAALDRQPTKLESFFAITKSLMLRALIIYFITSFFRRPAAPVATDSDGNSVKTIAAQNLFQNGTRMSLYVYISEKEEFTEFQNPDSLFWLKENLVYGDWFSGDNQDGSFSKKKEIPITKHLQNNGSLFLHAYLTRLGSSPDPNSQFYSKQQMTYVRRQLNRFKPQKISVTKNLLTGDSDVAVNATGKTISHWHPNMTLNLVVDHTLWSMGAVPAPMDEYIQFTADGLYYKPVLFANDFWNMARDYQPLNETLELDVTFQPLSMFKWQLYAAQTMRAKWNLLGDTTSETDEDQDTLKETLLDTSPYLLAITVAVSLLHSVFELLAFKNDIQFWNNRSSLEGLSVRSVFFGVFQSLVVLLYVLDNDTNTLVKVSCFVGLGIELWKIQKVVDVKWADGRLRFADKSSYVQSSTRQYDQLAFRYLSWVCFPLLVAYGMYALLYLEHKGWYSFVLDLLYGYLLTFGFIMMTPQLFINYKLKSVAHLPWRMLTYKFLNTFIDDMFAFVIKMPTLYRIGCFRDDIVFLVFLYQRWVYRVDKSRVNEFGFSGEQVQPAVKDAPAENDEKKAIEDKKTQ